MSESRTCDNCGKTATEESVATARPVWIHMDTPTHVAGWLSVADAALHDGIDVCSYRCGVEWLTHAVEWLIDSDRRPVKVGAEIGTDAALP